MVNYVQRIYVTSPNCFIQALCSALTGNLASNGLYFSFPVLISDEEWGKIFGAEITPARPCRIPARGASIWVVLTKPNPDILLMQTTQNRDGLRRGRASAGAENPAHSCQSRNRSVDGRQRGGSAVDVRSRPPGELLVWLYRLYLFETRSCAV
jgi:hypothetical protein